MKFSKDGLQLAVNRDLGWASCDAWGRKADHASHGWAHVAAQALRHSVLKKFAESDDVPEHCNRSAYQKFIEANDACKIYALADPLVKGIPILSHISHELFRLFGGIDLKGAFSDIAVGPRASVGARRNDPLSKFWDGPLTGTDSRLFGCYVRGCHSDQRWLDAEKQRHASFGYVSVKGSELCFVPKQDDVSRIVCTEPLVNSFYQHALRVRMERRLAQHYGIDIRSTQKRSPQADVNKRLAQEASLTGAFSTIDLRSASDYISVALCKAILPPRLFQALMVTRSPIAQVNESWVREDVVVHMMATMGNATTFPLQTGIFAAVVKCVQRIHGYDEKVNVFGDDIICRTECFDDVCNALTVLGFRVNLDKSFCVGSFRESCGGDYYQGMDVRGVYIRKMRCKMDYISAFNRLRRWSLQKQIPLFSTLLYLRRLIGSACYVPDGLDPGAGIITDFRRARRYGRVVFDRNTSTYAFPALHRRAKVSWCKPPGADAAILAALSGRLSSYPAYAESITDDSVMFATSLETKGECAFVSSVKVVKTTVTKDIVRALDWRCAI